MPVSANTFFSDPDYFGKTVLRAEHLTALNVLEKQPRRWMQLFGGACGKTTFGHHALAKFLYDAVTDTYRGVSTGPQAIMVSSGGSGAHFLCSTFLGYIRSFGGSTFNRDVVVTMTTRSQLFFAGPRKIEIHFTNEKTQDLFGRNVIGSWLDRVPGDRYYYEECLRRVRSQGSALDTLFLTT